MVQDTVNELSVTTSFLLKQESMTHALHTNGRSSGQLFFQLTQEKSVVEVNKKTLACARRPEFIYIQQHILVVDIAMDDSRVLDQI